MGEQKDAAAQRDGTSRGLRGPGHAARGWRVALRGRRGLAAAGVVVAACLVGWWLTRPPTPDAVLADAVAALNVGDCEALMRLAHPEEISRCHVTEAAVRGVLNETLWEHGRLTVAATKPFPPGPRVDHRGYEVIFVGDDPADWRHGFSLHVLDSPDRGWGLGLTELLRCACWRRAGFEVERVRYWQTVGRYGITGHRTQKGEWREAPTPPAARAGM